MSRHAKYHVEIPSIDFLADPARLVTNLTKNLDARGRTVRDAPVEPVAASQAHGSSEMPKQESAR